MSHYLVFQLYGPLAAWGDAATGEDRHTNPTPARSAIFGLLAAALGIRRTEQAELDALHHHYLIAFRQLALGTEFIDFHNAQLPDDEKPDYATRRDELIWQPGKVKTVISRRHYRSDAYYLIAIEAKPDAPWSLTTLCQALRSPRFPLYLGRKCCPPGLPLAPRCRQGTLAQVLRNNDIENNALHRFYETLLPAGGWQTRCFWEHQPHPPGLELHRTVERRDIPVSRQRWQFLSRLQYQGQLISESTDYTKEADLSAAKPATSTVAASSCSLSSTTAPVQLISPPRPLAGQPSLLTKGGTMYLSVIDIRYQELPQSMLMKLGSQQTYALHQLLWRLFPGQTSRNFLFREEKYLKFTRCYLLSDVLPAAHKPLHITSKPFTPQLTAGEQLIFSLRANPVITRDGQRSDVLMDARHQAPAGLASGDIRQLQQQAAINWLIKQGAKSGFSIQPTTTIADGYQQHALKKCTAPQPIRFSSIDFTGELTVNSPDCFIAALAKGFGKCKALGCGLMLIKRR